MCIRDRQKDFAYPYPRFHKVHVYVERVNGACPFVIEGDKLVFDLMLLVDECDISSDLPGYFEQKQICAVAFQGFYRYVKPMCFGVSAVDLGIATEGEDGFVLCPAWGPPTCEAAVIFRLHPEPVEKGWIDRWYEYLARAGHVSVPTFYFERFAPEAAKELRAKQLKAWEAAGKPKFWDGWDHPPCQPQRPDST